MPDGTIHFSAGLAVPEWLVLRGILAQSGLQGAVRFSFTDGSHVSSALEMDLRRIVGPWETGPVRLDRGRDELRVSNATESAVRVRLLNGYRDGRVVDSVALDVTLEAHGDTTVAWTPPEGAVLVADYETPVGGPVDIDEVRSFVEEVDVTAVFLNQTDPPASIDGEARIEGEEQTRRLRIGADTPAAEVTFPLPLTEAIAGPTVEYRLRPNGAAPTPWRRHQLTESAFIVLTGND